jgi:hypothetical protein
MSFASYTAGKLATCAWRKQSWNARVTRAGWGEARTILKNRH